MMRPIHRLIHLRYNIPPDAVLNEGPEHSPPPGERHRGVALPVAADLSRMVHAMQTEAYDAKRGGVDYDRLRRSPSYAEYRECARRLRSFDPASLSGREARLAFWINLYNALVVDAVIRFGVERSVNEVPGFFWRAAYSIGGQRYCAFDIEYGILRANRGHPAIPGRHFGPRDPRHRHSRGDTSGRPLLDPRIHFALVCAARACPPIAVYDPGRIDEQLDLAARSFVNGGGVRIDRASGEVHMSQIFRWYAPDFGARPLALGGKRPLLEFVAPYLVDEADRRFVLEGQPTVRFVPYDWTLNRVPGA